MSATDDAACSSKDDASTSTQVQASQSQSRKQWTRCILQLVNLVETHPDTLSDELLLEMYTDYPEVRQHMASVPKVKKRLFLTPSKLEMERDTHRYLVTMKEGKAVNFESKLLSSDEVVTCSNKQKLLNGTTFNKLFVESARYIEGKSYTLLDLSFAGEVWLSLNEEEIVWDRHTDIAGDIQICWHPIIIATLVRFTTTGWEKFALSNTDGIRVQQVRDILQAANENSMNEELGRRLFTDLRFIG